MAIVNSMFPMRGSLGDLTFYKNKDTGETIARMKHGPSKKQIMNDPRYEKFRLNGVEFGGRVRGGQLIARALGPLRRIVKPCFSQSLHKPLKAIRKRDTKNTTDIFKEISSPELRWHFAECG